MLPGSTALRSLWMQLRAVPSSSYMLVPDTAKRRRLIQLWTAATDSVQLDAESVGAQNYCQDPFLSTLSRYIDYTMLSRLFPVDVWRVLKLEMNVKIVACRCLVSIGAQNYCPDSFC